MFLEEITMEEFRMGLKKTKTIAVPFGSIEAHGTHLPLSTDTLIINEVVRKVSEKIPVFIAPPVYYGVCTSTGQHPGTIGITPATLRSLVMDIVRDGKRKGLENFVLISGHGGGIHICSMKEASEALMDELKGIRIAALSIYEVLGEEARKIAETANDSHAGEMETSLILFLAPTLVKGRAKEEYPKLPKPILVKDKLKYWPGAVWGNPGRATVEKGERLFNVMVQSVTELVKRTERTG